MMSSTRMWGAFSAAIVFVGLVACGERRGSTAEVTDTNTNWLKACDDDTGCGGLQCLCGVCTVACDATAECSRFATSAQCSTVDMDGCREQTLCLESQSTESSVVEDCLGSAPSCDGCGASAAAVCSDGNWICPTGSETCDSGIAESQPSTSSDSVASLTSSSGSGAGEVSRSGLTEVASDGGSASSDVRDAEVVADVCLDAVESGACSEDGVTCGGPCLDECQFCSLLVCTGGTWQRLEAFPAPCFSCGDVEECSGLSEYCESNSGQSFACKTLPDACQAEPTCACMAEQGIADPCVVEGNGLVVQTGGQPEVIEACSCTVWRTGSGWCEGVLGPDSEVFDAEWVCGDAAPILDLNEQCQPLATGAARWCCPQTFEPVCQ